MSDVRQTEIAYRAGDVEMSGTLYHPNGPARGGLLLFPEAPGPGQNVRERAERLAQAGYLAMACDLHGGGTIYQSMEEIMPRLEALRGDMATTRLRARAAYEALAQTGGVDPARIAAMGFCFGGTMALELGRSGAPLAAIVGFHSGLATSDTAGAANIKCPVLVCIGADDPIIPSEQRLAFEQEMRSGGVDWAMHVYGGVVHSFTDHNAGKMGRPEFARYDANADRQSWNAMIGLLERTLPV